MTGASNVSWSCRRPGWLRKYRVRVKGAPDEAQIAPLRKGIEVEGVRFQPMTVSIDRIQGANAWLTVSIREGKNREVRRAAQAVGLTVNRLIRVSYGPFQLGQLKPGEVSEVKGRVLRDQLGMASPAAADANDPSKSLAKRRGPTSKAVLRSRSSGKKPAQATITGGSAALGQTPLRHCAQSGFKPFEFVDRTLQRCLQLRDFAEGVIHT